MSHRAIADSITIAEIAVGSEVVRVEVKTLNGRPIFSAWRFWRDAAGTLRPGKHGLACSLAKLPELITAFEIALERAKEAGLVAPAAATGADAPR